MLRIATLVAAMTIALAVGTADAQEKRVTVYTAHISAIVDAMVPRFEKESGIKVDVVKLPSGDLVKRVRAEMAAPKADVIWSIGGDQLEENADLLQGFIPAEWSSIDPAYKISTNYLPYTGVMYVFAVNKSMLKPAEYPRTWADLADPKWKGKISSARADSSGSAFTQLTIVLSIFGDKGWDMYGRMFGNFTLSNSSGAVPPDGIALVKGAANVENAKRFIEWTLSKPTQEYLVSEIGRRSVRTDVPASAVLPPLSAIKLIKLDSVQIGKDVKDIQAKWRALAQARR